MTIKVPITADLKPIQSLVELWAAEKTQMLEMLNAAFDIILIESDSERASWWLTEFNKTFGENK